MIRLDTYPMGEIAEARPGSSQNVPSPPLILCLLHARVPAQHHLAVWVGGTAQSCEREEQQQVFCWQCTREVEIEIHLLQAGRTVKAWRGWWKGGNTIAHTGSLAVQVFCAGQSPPAGLATPPSPQMPMFLSSVTEQHNGAIEGTPTATGVLSWPALAEERTAIKPPPEDLPQEDDLWRESGLGEAIPEEAGEVGEEESGEETTEGEEQSEEKESDHEQGEAESLPTSRASDVGDSEAPTVIAAPEGTTLAAMATSPAWSASLQEQVRGRLTALLAQMPAKTLLVDLRRHPATPRTRSASRAHAGRSLGLTKELLRTLYGARYWDRGGMIPTTTIHPSSRSTQHRYRVVSQPEADGLGELITALTHGYSLIIVDSVESYAESERAAVIAELRQRVANLRLGSCS